MINQTSIATIISRLFLGLLVSGLFPVMQTMAEEPRIAPLRSQVATDAQATLSGSSASTAQLNITGTLANHPQLSKSWIGFATYLLRNSTLPARARELLIMRTGWLCNAEYEWGRHHLIATRVGLSEQEIERIKLGASSTKWSPEDRILMIAADELHATQTLTDATWKALSGQYNKQQLMDIVFTVGQYTLVAMAINSFGITLEEGIAGF